MSTGTVTLTRKDPIAVVTIAHPSRRNALGAAMWDDLRTVADDLHARPPRAVVVTGAGDAFCAGMDVNPDNPQIGALVEVVGRGDPAPGRALLAGLHATLDRLFSLPVPIVAAINGLAYGGGAELAARCDLRVADPAAVIAFSEVRLGLMPDLGGGVALARLIGPGRAAELILTARKVGAEEAFELGLVNRVTPPGGAVDGALELAGQIAANGPRAVRAALSVLRRAPGLPWAEALALELDTAAELIATGECRVGVTALFARTPPVFPDPPAG